MSETKLQGPVNLGNPMEINLITLGEVISKSLGLEPVFNHLPLPEDDPKQRRPDISLAKKLLGWEPKVSLELGIAKTAEWIKVRDN
jgi:nucleoside-diphosphate-sugar epimerase